MHHRGLRLRIYGLLGFGLPDLIFGAFFAYFAYFAVKMFSFSWLRLCRCRITRFWADPCVTNCNADLCTTIPTNHRQKISQLKSFLNREIRKIREKGKLRANVGLFWDTFETGNAKEPRGKAQGRDRKGTE